MDLHDIKSLISDLAFRHAKPEPTKPSIDWSHVSDEFNALATGPSGITLLFEIRPEKDYDGWYGGGVSAFATIFASFRRGTCNWRDSLVMRPGYEGK